MHAQHQSNLSAPLLWDDWVKVVMEEINIYLHNHILWKNMWNENFNGVYTWIFTKVRKTCSQETLSRGADWEVQESMLTWPVMREIEAKQTQLEYSRHGMCLIKLSNQSNLNTWRTEQNGQNFTDNILRWIYRVRIIANHFDSNIKRCFPKNCIDRLSQVWYFHVKD